MTEDIETEELQFWKEIVATTLQPIPEKLTRATELKKSLDTLRNSMLIAMFFCNLIAIMFFLTFTFKELQSLNINPEVLIVVFLGVYGLILVIQFVTMIVHRFITLAHYIGRLNEKPGSAHGGNINSQTTTTKL